MKLLTLNLLVLLAVTGLAGMAEAASKTCRAYYRIDPRQGALETIEVGHFTARGWCGRFQSKACRNRAHNRAQKCMEKHWERRNVSYFPEECQEVRFPDHPWRLMRDARVEGYLFTELYQDLQNNFCDLTEVTGDRYADVYAVTRGGDGCNETRRLASRVRFSCP